MISYLICSKKIIHCDPFCSVSFRIREFVLKITRINYYINKIFHNNKLTEHKRNNKRQNKIKNSISF